MATIHAIAPAHKLPGKIERPWKIRAPFQIMPQAINRSALGIAWVLAASCTPHRLTAEPPIR
jgi:hypothetical protein